MVGGIVGAVAVVALGAAVLRPWQHPPDVRRDDPAEQVQNVTAQPSLAAALAYVRPAFRGDTSDGGHMLLTLWALQRMQWADVAVAENETSYPLAKKDPSGERGKRLCVAVRILDIRAEDFAKGRKAFQGLAISQGPGPTVPYRFTAVRSTGDLVANNKATFCGVVTGLFSYD